MNSIIIIIITTTTTTTTSSSSSSSSSSHQPGGNDYGNTLHPPVRLKPFLDYKALKHIDLILYIGK